MIPKIVDIYGKPYKVHRKKDLSDSSGRLDGWHCPKGDIYIDAELKGKDLMETFIHECMHGIFKRTGLATNVLSEDTEELICSVVPPWLVEKFNIRYRR